MSQVFHHNRINKSGRTRVSFDFRVIPLSEWETDVEVKNSVQSGRKFVIGDGDMDYYTTFDKRTGEKYDFSSRASTPAAGGSGDEVEA